MLGWKKGELMSWGRELIKNMFEGGGYWWEVVYVYGLMMGVKRVGDWGRKGGVGTKGCVCAMRRNR